MKTIIEYVCNNGEVSSTTTHRIDMKPSGSGYVEWKITNESKRVNRASPKMRSGN